MAATAVDVSHTRLARFLALGGIIAPVLFASMIVVGGFAFDGYSHISYKVSELGGDEASSPAIQNVNFMLLGLLVIGFAGALHHDLRRWGIRSVGPAFFAVFGLSSALLNSVLPCDADCDGTTVEALLHNLTGFGGFLVAIAGMVIMARVFRRDARWRSYYRFTQFCIAWALIALVANAAADDSIGGLMQRIFIASFLTWIEVTAIGLYRRLSVG